MKHLDDSIATQICCVRKWRPPVTLATNQRILVQQLGVPGNELTNNVNVVAPNSINQIAGLDEPEPTWCFVTASKGQLSVSELSLGWDDRVGVITIEFC